MNNFSYFMKCKIFSKKNKKKILIIFFSAKSAIWVKIYDFSAIKKDKKPWLLISVSTLRFERTFLVSSTSLSLNYFKLFG